MADLKAGENMTGKFSNSLNKVCFAYCIITSIVAIIGGAVVIVKSGLYEVGFIITILVVGVIILPIFPLRKCEFSADDEKVVFREAFLKRTYCFSEIKSASTQVGFFHSRYGASARVEFVITLSDGRCITYRYKWRLETKGYSLGILFCPGF